MPCCRLFSKSRILAQHTRAARAKFLRIMQVTAPCMPLPQQGSCTLSAVPSLALAALPGSWMSATQAEPPAGEGAGATRGRQGGRRGSWAAAPGITAA